MPKTPANNGTSPGPSVNVYGNAKGGKKGNLGGASGTGGPKMPFLGKINQGGKINSPSPGPQTVGTSSEGGQIPFLPKKNSMGKK